MGSATWSKPRTPPTGCAIASEAAAEAPAATIPFTKRRRDAGLDIHNPDSLLEALKGITTRGGPTANRIRPQAAAQKGGHVIGAFFARHAAALTTDVDDVGTSRSGSPLDGRAKGLLKGIQI